MLSQELKPGENLEAGAHAHADHGGQLLTGLVPLACLACFLVEPTTASPGMAPQWATLPPPPINH